MNTSATTSSTPLIATIEARLADLAPLELHIEDESHLHAGHAGAAGGGGHFRLHLVSAAFASKTTLARHRLIHAALDGLIPQQIHALAIRALAPGEPSGSASSN